MNKDIKDKIKYKIIEKVSALQGCKVTDLVANVVKDARIINADFKDSISDLIEELISENELIEIRYTLKDLDYRVKSFLIPKETEVSITSYLISTIEWKNGLPYKAGIIMTYDEIVACLQGIG